MFANSTGLCAAFIASIHHLQRSMALHGATVVGLCIALFALMPAMTFAQQGKISVDSIRILNTTPDFVDVELSGSNDGSRGQLYLGMIAKSTDGIVRSTAFQPVAVPGEKQFRVLSQGMRPSSLGPQQTDYLMVMVYTGQGTVLLRSKFDWPHVWQEKKASTVGRAVDSVELSEAHPWRIFSLNLDEEDFAALDILMRKWNDPKERDHNGEWKLDSFRQVFVNYSSGKRDWKGDLQRIKRWQAFNPKSAGAAIAEAKYWAAYAWHIRGNETSTQADPVALRVFGERMQRAEKVLQEAKDFSVDNPLWYEAYLDIAVATKRKDKFIEALFNEAIRRHPHFQPLYLNMAKHWVPRSGDMADWNKVDGVIKQAVSNAAEMDSASNYALLYAQISELQKFEFDLFRDSLVSWVKMRDSYEGLVKRYPSADNLNEFAAFACRANDKSAYLNIRPLIKHIVPKKWPGNYSYDLCDRRFLQNV